MTRASDPNRSQVERAFAELVTMSDELTIVGGCAAGFLITDSAAQTVRPTFDVDLAVEAATYIEFHILGDRLRALGFQQGTLPDDPMCRWRKGDIVLDVMPMLESTLGFGNRWYRSAISHRQTSRLPGGLNVHHIDAQHFLATKLAAFEARGGGDVIASHDVEDIVRVVDGRPSVAAEFQNAAAELRTFVSRGLTAVMTDRYFGEAMPGFFGSGSTANARARLVEGRLKAMITT